MLGATVTIAAVGNILYFYESREHACLRNLYGTKLWHMAFGTGQSGGCG